MEDGGWTTYPQLHNALTTYLSVATWTPSREGPIRYEWDEAKSLANKAKHGIGFDAIERFEWDSALEFIDDREHYGELREVAIGFIGDSLHCVIFTTRHEVVRIISLRRATNREKRRYVQDAR